MAQYDEYLFHRINETDYRQTQSESENERMNRRIELDRIQRQFERARDEEIRRAEERRRTLEQMRRHIHEEVDGFDEQVGGFAFFNMFGIKTKKETLTERLAVKYCFFLNRMISIASGKFAHSESLSKKLHKANDWFSEDSVRNKLYKAIINEGSKNGIKSEEIDSEIRRINAELGGRAISELLIGQFIGAVAIKMFKNNPNIIKDTGKVKKTSPQPQSEEGIGGLNTMEAIREILRRMQEGERDNRVQVPGILPRPYNGNDWLRHWQQIDTMPITPTYYDIIDTQADGNFESTKSWSLKGYMKDIFNI